VEVMPGYKQTDVGIVPEDWEVHTIGEAMRLINGRAFKPEDWKDQGLPIIRIQNLNDPESMFNRCGSNSPQLAANDRPTHAGG
jgi:type I restriction enzyme S subunit